MKMELEYIEKLAELVSKNELTEIIVEEGDRAVTIRKEKEMISAVPAVQPQLPAQVSAPTTVPSPAATPAQPKKGVEITSPMVGTFYRASSPGAEPFTEVGKVISEGQVVCIIEAMKLMNEIESEVSGKIIEICVEDGQPVEFGQTLMIVAP